MPKPGNLETEQIRELLSALNPSDGLDFPICVEHRDKPDFVLSTRNGRCVGVETTFYTDAEIFRGHHLHHTEFPKACVTVDGLRDRPVPRKKKELVESMITQGTDWDSDGVAHEARKVVEAIKLKREKFNAAGFTKFPDNWLLLTGFLNDTPDKITANLFVSHLNGPFRNGELANKDFSRIYICYGSLRLRITETEMSWKLLSP